MKNKDRKWHVHIDSAPLFEEYNWSDSTLQIVRTGLYLAQLWFLFADRNGWATSPHPRGWIPFQPALDECWPTSAAKMTTLLRVSVEKPSKGSRTRGKSRVMKDIYHGRTVIYYFSSQRETEEEEEAGGYKRHLPWTGGAVWLLPASYYEQWGPTWTQSFLQQFWFCSCQISVIVFFWTVSARKSWCHILLCTSENSNINIWIIIRWQVFVCFDTLFVYFASSVNQKWSSHTHSPGNSNEPDFLSLTLNK